LNGIFRYKNNQPVNWFNRAQSKSNQYCLYCGQLVGDGSTRKSNKEHLIGRDFVPTGEFGGGDSFNFIFRACKECNDEKSAVERHISSVTLFNSPARASSPTHNELAERKASKDYHPSKKGTLIKNSGDQFNIAGTFGPANISFGVSGPPQANPDYIKFLAFRHIQGFFSLITSQNPLTVEGTSLLSSKFFFHHSSCSYADWGNPQLVEIMKRARDIPCYANITTANGFFRAIMRRSRDELGEWFWALEWNKSLRIVGAIAQPEILPNIFRDLPDFKWTDLGMQDGAKTRMREEIPLRPEHDLLFDAQIENAESA